jgi:hypothetical protein
MMFIGRIAAGLIAIAAVYLAILSVVRTGHDLISTMIQAVLILIAFYLLWFATLSHLPSEWNKLARTLVIALIIGAIGLIGGYVGPLIVTPGANQGPLLGIFITGPVGFVLGSIGGFFWTRFT